MYKSEFSPYTFPKLRLENENTNTPSQKGNTNETNDSRLFQFLMRFGSINQLSTQPRSTHFPISIKIRSQLFVTISSQNLMRKRHKKTMGFGMSGRWRAEGVFYGKHPFFVIKYILYYFLPGIFQSPGV